MHPCLQFGRHTVREFRLQVDRHQVLADVGFLDLNRAEEEWLHILLNVLGVHIEFGSCSVPCDHVPVRSWPLFRAREVMPALIKSLRQELRS